MGQVLTNTNGSAKDTGKLMHRMVQVFHNDMLPYASLSVFEVFDIVKNIPFRDDPIGLETLMRPAFTMRSKGSGGDCDDKAICFASYCFLVGIPYRFMAVKKNPQKNLHHVYTDIYLNNKWVNADATYRFNTLGQPREIYDKYVVI